MESESKKRKIEKQTPEVFRLDSGIVENSDVQTPETVVNDDVSTPDFECDGPSEYKLSCIGNTNEYLQTPCESANIFSPHDLRDESFSSCTSDPQMPQDVAQEYASCSAACKNPEPDNSHPDKYHTSSNTASPKLRISTPQTDFMCPYCAVKMTVTQFVNHKCNIPNSSDTPEPPDRKKDNGDLLNESTNRESVRFRAADRHLY